MWRLGEGDQIDRRTASQALTAPAKKTLIEFPIKPPVSIRLSYNNNNISETNK
jgi:hypothetical protein